MKMHIHISKNKNATITMNLWMFKTHHHSLWKGSIPEGEQMFTFWLKITKTNNFACGLPCT